MKKQVITALLFFFLPVSMLLAQKDSVITLPGVTVTAISKVNQKIDKVFKQSFPKATNLHWYKQDKDYLAKFIKEDMKHNALFTKNGYMKYDISFGYESNVPEEVKSLVQSSYADCSITRAINLKGQDRDVWVLNLESMNHYYTVSVEEGELNVIEQFDKAK
ncbi:MAG TPA: hypothetical protein VFS36_13865 [Chitinophagaceae bacterium]|jgi:hypothetical protein|nr:hypothetical protein [Chitinophagaceae bacterium]